MEKAAAERPGWLDEVIDYHVHGSYGQSIGAEGFDGYIRCLQERQKRELRILSALNVPHLILCNAQRDWQGAYRSIQDFIGQGGEIYEP